MSRRVIGGVPRMGGSIHEAMNIAFNRPPTNFPKEPPPMSSSPELIARREAAGQRYADAAGALAEALVELAALDGLVDSPDIANTDKNFAAYVPEALPDLRHRQFLPKAPRDLLTAVRNRRAQIRAEITAAA